jgi:hypothetical protein
MPHVGFKEIAGEKYEVHASPYGRWAIIEKDDDGNATELGGSDKSLDAAVANARVELNKRKVTLAIHFKTLEGGRGIATGIHGKTRKVLTRVDGKAQQMDRYAKTLKPDTPMTVIKRYKDLVAEGNRIEAEKREIIKKWTFDLDAEVRRQIKEATS